MENALVVDGVVREAPKSELDERRFEWSEIARKPVFQAFAVLVVGLCVAFWPLMNSLQTLWFAPDSLYSHGPLIPLMSLWILWERWPKIASTPVKGAWWAIIPLIGVMYVAWIASRTTMENALSALFLAALLLSVVIVAGLRWAWAVVLPVVFLSFSMPFWSGLVDRYTQPLQVLSTDMAVQLLKIFGWSVVRTDTTTVYLDHFQMNVAAACSGAKTTLALFAFSVFFIFLGRGRWYSAVALLALLLPFSLLINGVRIALVGAIGDTFGSDAGMMFHDYGGYLVIILGFMLLKKGTALLGFKQ